MIDTSERVAVFVAKIVGHPFVPPYTCMGIERQGRIVGGVVFNHFEGADIHVTIAGHGWTRGFLADVGQYVFEQLKCERMTAVTEQPAIVRIGERLGGQIEGCLRNHFGPDRDGFIIGILKHEYRF